MSNFAFAFLEDRRLFAWVMDTLSAAALDGESPLVQWLESNPHEEYGNLHERYLECCSCYSDDYAWPDVEFWLRDIYPEVFKEGFIPENLLGEE